MRRARAGAAGARHQVSAIAWSFTIVLVPDATVEQLFADTLRGDYEDDAPWDAVRKLRHLATREVFNVAARWCASKHALERARGLDVVAQLGKTVTHPANRFPDECYALVVSTVTHETEERPLDSGITALGHIGNPTAVPLIAQFHSHKSSEIRFAVAFALGCFPNDPLSTHTLLKLMRDSDKDVRDWATFGLGVQGDQDSPEIRDALLGALADSDEDVVEEALVSLAKRRDTRVVPVLLAKLREPNTTTLVIEAAYTLLGLPDDRKDWSQRDYARAVAEQFRETP